ncbi:DNA polymerase III subunit gamma/tau [Candidatus Saganbacteria bacterium]|nr:DNA polymerase III subunit gamma/tau [Candidatus Saganbacteria bacterium]
MSYLSLYRKWRSQDFDGLVGQPAIVQTLKNAIKNNRLAHAYLFSGPRGTGKTSTARILAKALNCAEGLTDKPCGVCENCKKIRDGHSVNVNEIDAASNRGIDEIRELRERVRYVPIEGRYKVYIIDEVHMLTSEAFNALLKTLEEPPAHTIFILATTELQKVPATISSRCQRLDFTRIKLAEIEEHLKKIAAAEGFTIDAKAINLIARVGEGAMRDSISLLDQVVSFAGKEVSYDKVITLLGTADEDLLSAFGEAIAAGEVAQLMGLVASGLAEGRSIQQVTRDLVGHFRNLLHIKVGSGEILELTSDHQAKLQKQAPLFPFERLTQIIKTLSRAELDMKWHPYARLVLEVALLELIGDCPMELKLVSKFEEQTSGQEFKKTTEQQTLPPLQDGKLAKVKTHWSAILESVKKKSVFGYVSLHEGEPVEINDQGKLVITFRRGYAFHKERLEESKNRTSVEESLREVMGNVLPIECIISEEKKESGLSAAKVAEFFEGRVL